MKERPILFSGPMVRAILAGRKTMTRRVIKPQPPQWCTTAGISALTPPGQWEFRGDFCDRGPASKFLKCPYLPASETRLWVRENWGQQCPCCPYHFQATEPDWAVCSANKWRPSIHMPRVVSRITLLVTAVRAERLQAITEEDATAEGVDAIPAAPAAFTHRTSFAKLWDKLNKQNEYSWESNPWVWVITFRRIEP